MVPVWRRSPQALALIGDRVVDSGFSSRERFAAGIAF